jgi:hypothetical protein
MGTSSLGWQVEQLSDPDRLASDHLLPVQYAELLQRSSVRTPELKLMAAVLEDAIRCFCQCAGSPGLRSQRLFRETAEWFESHDASWPFAFENVCEYLALEPDWIRGLLARWRNGRKPVASWPVAIPRVRLRIAGSRHSVRAGAPGLGRWTAGTSPSDARLGAGW